MTASPNVSHVRAAPFVRRRALLSTDDGRIYVVVYEPRDPCSPSLHVAFCPPLGEEQAHARGPLHQVAARLAEAGHRATIYDPRGHGDSEGEFAAVRLSTLAVDLARSAERIDVLVGVRFGAVVAAAAILETLVWPARLVLVAPILSGQPYARDLLRKNVAAQIATTGRAGVGVEELEAQLARGEPIDMDGHTLSSSLYRDLVDARVVDALSKAPASDVSVDVLTWAPLVSTASRISAEISELTRRRPDVRVDAIREAAFWKEDRRLVVTELPALSARLVDFVGTAVARHRRDPPRSARGTLGEDGS